jgi:hypothetical protein
LSADGLGDGRYPEAITAEYRQGVLTVTIPDGEQANARRLPLEPLPAWSLLAWPFLLAPC